MILADTNLIIYAASKKHAAPADWFVQNKPAVSVLSIVEALGDALIAATALHHDLSLATHNAEDFNWIKSLTIVDPLEE